MLVPIAAPPRAEKTGVQALRRCQMASQGRRRNAAFRPLAWCPLGGAWPVRRIGDITVTIRKRNERSFAAAGLDLPSLAGRRIRVRGWLEARGGDRAWIEAERPEQIEMAD